LNAGALMLGLNSVSATCCAFDEIDKMTETSKKAKVKGAYLLHRIFPVWCGKEMVLQPSISTTFKWPGASLPHARNKVGIPFPPYSLGR